MKSYSRSHWKITIPDDWAVEEEADYTSLYHPDGVGDLLISSFEHDQKVSDEDLEEFATDHFEGEVEPEQVEHGDFIGFTLCYDIDNEYICEWYLRSEEVMLFVTYSCPLDEEENSEEDIVETMLDSLQKI